MWDDLRQTVNIRADWTSPRRLAFLLAAVDRRAPGPAHPRPNQGGSCESFYDAFTVQHSGSTKIPVRVAQQLIRQIFLDANEKRAKLFFADARMHCGERAKQEDYKNPGYSREHSAGGRVVVLGCARLLVIGSRSALEKGN